MKYRFVNLLNLTGIYLYIFMFLEVNDAEVLKKYIHDLKSLLVFVEEKDGIECETYLLGSDIMEFCAWEYLFKRASELEDSFSVEIMDEIVDDCTGKDGFFSTVVGENLKIDIEKCLKGLFSKRRSTCKVNDIFFNRLKSNVAKAKPSLCSKLAQFSSLGKKNYCSEGLYEHYKNSVFQKHIQLSSKRKLMQLLFESDDETINARQTMVEKLKSAKALLKISERERDSEAVIAFTDLSEVINESDIYTDRDENNCIFLNRPKKRRKKKQATPIYDEFQSVLRDEKEIEFDRVASETKEALIEEELSDDDDSSGISSLASLSEKDLDTTALDLEANIKTPPPVKTKRKIQPSTKSPKRSVSSKRRSNLNTPRKSPSTKYVSTPSRSLRAVIERSKFSSARSRRIAWTADEEEVIRKEVMEEGNFGNWRYILDEYPHVFHKSRTNVGVKDKWRNMSKYYI